MSGLLRVVAFTDSWHLYQNAMSQEPSLFTKIEYRRFKYRARNRLDLLLTITAMSP